jgi:predicted secreted protein
MSKYSSFGTVLEMGRGDTSPGPETFDEIANVTNIGGPSLSLDTTDVTSHEQATAWEEVVATILRTGEVSLDIVYDPADDTHDYVGTRGLVRKKADKTLANFKMTFTDTASTEWAFSAYVTGFEPGAPVDGALTASVSLKISGVPTLA